MIKINRDPLEVSEHAIVRYLERGMGFNLDIVRQHIKSICEGAHAIGAVSVRAEGLRFGNRRQSRCDRCT